MRTLFSQEHCHIKRRDRRKQHEPRSELQHLHQNRYGAERGRARDGSLVRRAPDEHGAQKRRPLHRNIERADVSAEQRPWNHEYRNETRDDNNACRKRRMTLPDNGVTDQQGDEAPGQEELEIHHRRVSECAGDRDVRADGQPSIHIGDIAVESRVLQQS